MTKFNRNTVHANIKKNFMDFNIKEIFRKFSSTAKWEIQKLKWLVINIIQI